MPVGWNGSFAAAAKVFRGWLGRVYSLRVGEENMSMRMICFSVISIGLAAGIAVGQTSGSTKDSKAKADYKVSPSIFEDGPSSAALKHPKVTPPDPAPAEKSQKAPEAPTPAPPAAEPATPAAPVVMVERVDAPPQELKEVTAQDIARVKVGSSEKELKAILGNPASRVEIPDDDGRLNVTMQYWGNGKLQGILRIENGKVVSVEGRK
jgi:hypothetical protein